jgi:hypothetical protein
MNMQGKFAALAILAAFVLGTVNVSGIAYAEKPTDPDCWGEESAQQGQTGEQGEHASDPLPDEEGRETPRLGIGNLAPHPSDLGEALNDPEECDPE